MRVLLTGSGGFVGKNVIKYLDEVGGIEVVVMNKQTLESVTPDNLEEIDIIIHLAGKAHDLKSTSAPEQYYRVNYDLTKKLYSAFLQSGAKKFIFMSSVKAVADNVDDILYEDVQPAPKTDYGKSKLLAEEFIRNNAPGERKKYYILRPCMIHGPGNKGNLTLLYNVIKRRIPYPLAAFENKRSFLSIANLCFVINEIIDREDFPEGVYNVADDVDLSTNSLVKIISTGLNKRTLLLPINATIIRYLARIGDIFKLPLNTERLQKLTENYRVANKKITSAMNKKLPLSSEAGLEITIKSFIDRL